MPPSVAKKPNINRGQRLPTVALQCKETVQRAWHTADKLHIATDPTESRAIAMHGAAGVPCYGVQMCLLELSLVLGIKQPALLARRDATISDRLRKVPAEDAQLARICQHIHASVTFTAGRREDIGCESELQPARQQVQLA